MTHLDQAIASQPGVLAAVLDLEIDAALERLTDAGPRVSLVGTGTSQHAAEIGAQMLRLAGKDAVAESAATFAGRQSGLAPQELTVLITHTGETAFARRVREQALSRRAPLLSITGEGVGWEEAIEVAPRERSETYTASYTAAMLLLARLSVALGAEGLGQAALDRVPATAEQALADPLPELDPGARVTVLAGWGPGAVTAREGALKIREAARLIAEGYEGEYLLHGSAVPLRASDQLVLLDPNGDPDGLLPRLGDAARAAGLTVRTLAGDSGTGPLLGQIPLTIQLQRLAADLARQGAHDPDEVIVGPWAGEALWKAGRLR